jgi:hypothetical protein
MHLEVNLPGIELAEDRGFAGAGLSVPLGAGPASGQKLKRKRLVGKFRRLARRFKVEHGFAVRSEELSVLEQASFLQWLRVEG